MKNKQVYFVLLCFLLMVSFLFSSPIQEMYALEDGFFASYEDVDFANKSGLFGPFIKTEMKEQKTGVSGQKNENGEIIFKLFGFIPIKKVAVRMTSDDDFYVGGVPIGLEINAQGAIVVNKDNPDLSLKEGDIITHINGKQFENLEEIGDILQEVDEESEIEVDVLRDNKSIKSLVKAHYDDNTNRYKLGLWVKDDVSGVGTLTFVNKNTLDYGALGHAIVDTSSQNIVPVSSGKVYQCNLIGINKGKKNEPGELRCVFVPNSKEKGFIESNSRFGIRGTLTNTDGIVDENKTAKLGGRLGVKPGKAKIVSTISGIREEYEIEIIKANFQSKAKDKSLVFRVKDRRLLELSGGIVQGMSGSPIIQNGKIVGAVTHVFTSDPTKGYGVYVDWML